MSDRPDPPPIIITDIEPLAGSRAGEARDLAEPWAGEPDQPSADPLGPIADLTWNAVMGAERDRAAVTGWRGDAWDDAWFRAGGETSAVAPGPAADGGPFGASDGTGEALAPHPADPDAIPAGAAPPATEAGDAAAEDPEPVSAVMPGLVPGIHVFPATSEGVDGRDKPGHDASGDSGVASAASTPIDAEPVRAVATDPSSGPGHGSHGRAARA
ncbi:MAG: hypothetical protein ABSG76_20965, partial [Xanthobacteraceae bacterium]